MRATSLSRCFLLFIFIVTAVQFLYGEDALVPGIPIERKIVADQEHTYNISLQQDQYLRLVVEQKGIDLGIVVLAPDGREIGDIDNSNGTNGFETVTLVGEVAGIYKLKVLSLDAFRRPEPGRYEIRILELRNASDRELKTGRIQQLMRTKGVVLLNEVLTQLPSLRNSVQRTGYEIEVAGMMWKFDSNFAAGLLNRAAEKFREIIMSGRSVYLGYNTPTAKLRAKIIEQMREHEPEAALTFARSTRNSVTSLAEMHHERDIELSIANKIAAFNPQAAYQIAEDNLNEEFSPAILATVNELKSKSPELASLLLHHVMARLSAQPLIGIPANASMATGVVRLVRPGESLLQDTELRSLLQKMTAEVVAYVPDRAAYSYQRQIAMDLVYSLKQVKGTMQTISPEQLASIELRLTPKPTANEFLADPIAISIQKTPEEDANELRRDAIEKFTSERNFEEVFRHLEQIPAEERSELIGDIVDAIGDAVPRLKRSTANAFLERARRELPSSPRAEDEDELKTLLTFVEPYARVDPDRAFEIVEPLIDQFNDLAAAAWTMNGFVDRFYEDGDFITGPDNSVSTMADGLSIALGRLGLENFQRAKSDADRIRPLSARIEMYLKIAKAAISGPVLEKQDE